MTALPAAQVRADPYEFPFDGPLRPERTACILLGFQTENVQECAAAGHAAQINALRLAGALSAEDVPLLIGRRGAKAHDIPARRRRGPDRIVPRGDPGWELAPKFGALGGTVFDHPSDNAFLQSPLSDLVADRPTLLVSGLRTEGAVHATMRAANDQGQECLLVSDATASDTASFHEAILSITAFGGGLFGAHAPVDAILEALA